jgi:hypothetical protein
MKLIIFILLSGSVLFAKEHYAKLEPYELKTVSSNVSARVMFADIQKESTLLDNKDYIVLDDKLDKIERSQIKKKVALLHKMIRFNREIIKNYDALLKKKIKNLKIKSSVEKDREFYDLMSSQNQYINTQKELETLNIQLNDLMLRDARLKKSIEDKHVHHQGFVLYKLHVKEGQFVTPATPLADLADLSKGKLTIYLSRDEMKDIDKKVLYLEGKKSHYKISKIWNIADTKHVSSYRAEIIIDAPTLFSKLLKIELRDE